MQPGMKEAVFPLDEGQAVVQWPERLSPESFEDFENWLSIVIRKAKRSVRADAPDDATEEPFWGAAKTQKMTHPTPFAAT